MLFHIASFHRAEDYLFALSVAKGLIIFQNTFSKNVCIWVKRNTVDYGQGYYLLHILVMQSFLELFIIHIPLYVLCNCYNKNLFYDDGLKKEWERLVAFMRSLLQESEARPRPHLLTFWHFQLKCLRFSQQIVPTLLLRIWIFTWKVCWKLLHKILLNWTKIWNGR